MKQLYVLMLVVMMTSVAFTGCVSDDDDDDSTTETVIEVSHENYSWTELTNFQSAPEGCDMGEDECEGYAEISAYDPTSKNIFVVNAVDSSIDIVNLEELIAGTHEITRVTFDGEPNSVALCGGTAAVAVANNDKQANGAIHFLDSDGTKLSNVAAGALPDMVTFTSDCGYALSANEGEPDDDYIVDPEGTVTIVAAPSSGNWADATSSGVTTANFNAYDNQKATLIADGVRIFGPSCDADGCTDGGASVSQDLEPEYIGISGDDKTAFVVLQEANALAMVDIASAEVTNLVALGAKDMSLHMFDMSDRNPEDGGYNASSWPVMSFYMPDAMACYSVSGNDYCVTANEGDSRDYDGYSEEVRGDDLDLDDTAFPNEEQLLQKDHLGRLKVTTANGDTDGDGDYDIIYGYGGRSFSIWDSTGKQVYDSGNEIEVNVVAEDGTWMNSYTGSRSDDKGPEPEGVDVGVIDGKIYAFIGLERSGGVMVYDITDVNAPVFFEYMYFPDHVSPEGITFISASDSPTDNPLLVVNNEVSGTTFVAEFSDKSTA